MAMNIFIFTGNLGKDAEQKFLPNGDSVVSFSVPVKSGFGAKESTAWMRCAMFGKRGESVLPYLKKGQLVGVSGEFSAREWTNNDGVKQTSLEVRVDKLDLLGSKQSGGSQNDDHGNDAPAPAKTKPKPSFDDLGDDIPF